MSVRRNSSRTNVNSAYNTAAVQTSNSKTIAPDTAVLRETSGGSFAPTITAVAITNSDYNIIDDTNVSTGGGYIRITGTGFVSGCVVYIGGVAALSTTLLNSTQVNVQISATSSNTLHVYLVNPDGSAAIYLSGITFSGVPTWVTDPTISGLVNEVAFSIGLSATSNSTVAYSLTAGSTLPPGTTLTSAGVFSGTVSGLSAETTYSFSVTATDLELQDTPRTFSVTVAIGDPYFYLTPVLLNGEANVWIRDSSTNNFLPTIGGDTRPVAFSPYNSNWSTYFDGSNDDVRVGGNNNLAFGTGDFTIEMFFNSGIVGGSNQASFLYDGRTTSNPEIVPIIAITPSLTVTFGTGAATVVTSGTIVLNRWYHLVVSRVSGSTRMFLNGVQTGSTASDANNYLNNSGRPCIGTQGYGDPFFNYTGYISNLRVLKGTGTTSPTVPTAPLTAIENTQLLLFQSNIIKDNSTNGFAITAFADRPATKSFAPFVETDLITGSAYFDGTTDFLTIADNAALELGAGDFCVELWIHPTTVSGTGTIIDKRSGTYGPLLFWRFGATLQLYMSSNNSSWNLANGVTVGTVTANQWYHIAIYRVGSTIYSAFNGTVSTVTASGSATPHNNAGAWYFGTGTNGSSDPYTGYMSDMRFVIGSGVYTGSNFTPPATSLTAITNTQLLTLQYRRGDNNHRFVEESGVRALTTRTGNPSQGSFSPFSPARWSAYFDGTGDYLTVTGSSNLAFGTSDFTIEMFVLFNSTGQVNFYDQRPQSTNGLYPTIYVTGSAFIAYRTNSADRITSDAVITANRWYHLVVSRVSSVTRMFIDGVQQTQTYNDTNSYLNGTTRPVIGSGGDGQTVVLNGYISNLRVLNGTGYTTVTVPTVPLTAIANTQLLTLQDNRFVDNSTNAFVITRFGDTSVRAFSPFRASGAYSPTLHGGSAYFDGSGDYVYIARDAAMTLGTNDHCIELWMYPNGAQNQYTSVWYYSVGSASGATNTYYFSIGSDSGGGISVLGGPLSGVWAVTLGGLGSTEYTAVLNTWTHVVLTRRGSAYRLFLNGVLKAYTTYAGSIIAQGGSFSIGWDGANATTYYKGWISDFKVINGSIPTAYQTSSTTTGTTIFTPPTSVPAFEANTAMAMSFTNGGIVDATGRITFETLADTKISNVASKFGSGSLYFDGTGDYVVAPSNPAFGFGTGDFTIECWIYFNSTSGTFVPFAQSDALGSSTNDKWFFALGSNTLRLQTHSAGGFTCTTPWTPSTGMWYHIAAVRSSGTILLFINGTSGTVTTTGTPSGYSLSQNGLSIGAMSTPYHLNGYIDDFRITRFARYTASFTAPTSPFLTK
jgi:hypothetical protein